jgi:hypothetical protein
VKANDAVEKVVLAIFERRKSLIYIGVKIKKSAFLDFFYSVNVEVTGLRGFLRRSG